MQADQRNLEIHPNFKMFQRVNTEYVALLLAHGTADAIPTEEIVGLNLQLLGVTVLVEGGAGPVKKPVAERLEMGCRSEAVLENGGDGKARVED